MKPASMSDSPSNLRSSRVTKLSRRERLGRGTAREYSTERAFSTAWGAERAPSCLRGGTWGPQSPYGIVEIPRLREEKRAMSIKDRLKFIARSYINSFMDG